MTRPPVVLILAAGRGQRFAASGGVVHKLQALLAGKPVLAHTLAAVQASGLAWHVVRASPKRPGMGDSIAAGVAATAAAGGWLVLPGDLPLVLPSSLRAVAQALTQHSLAQHHAAQSSVVQPWACVPSYQGQRGHPAGFAAACRPALLALKGDSGARALLQTFNAQELSLDDPGIVCDIDTVADLQYAEQRLLLRAARQ